MRVGADSRHIWIWLDCGPAGLSRDTRAAFMLAQQEKCRATGIISLHDLGEYTVESLASELALLSAHGLTLLSLQEQDSLQPESLADALVYAIRQSGDEKPTDILATAHARGRDLCARAAASLNAPLLQDCVSLRILPAQGDKFLFSGRITGVYAMPEDAPLHFWTVRPHVLAADVLPSSGEGSLLVREVSVPPMARPRVRVIYEDEEAAPLVSQDDSFTAMWKEQPDIFEASIVLGGGRPLGSKENFSLLHSLAKKLGAAVGASRTAVDLGYAPPSVQIGQTGVVVSPELYISFGISGSIYHLAGLRTARRIVAIDTDPASAMFSRADYGLVGDLFAVLPLLEALIHNEP